MLSKPASAARPAVTKPGGSCGSAASPTASRVIGNVIAKITTPEHAERKPARTVGTADSDVRIGSVARKVWIGRCHRRSLGSMAST